MLEGGGAFSSRDWELGRKPSCLKLTVGYGPAGEIDEALHPSGGEAPLFFVQVPSPHSPAVPPRACDGYDGNAVGSSNFRRPGIGTGAWEARPPPQDGMEWHDEAKDRENWRLLGRSLVTV